MTRQSADKHLERLLVMVPWIVQSDGPTVDEVCTRFGIGERELAADLELLFMCGLYPFTPDTLIEADIVDGRVWIRSAEQFERPPTFTPEEAVSLVAAASTVANLPGNESNDVLRSALGKLAYALGIDDEEVVDIDLAPAAPVVIDAMKTAVEQRRTVRCDYYSYGRDAWNVRRFEPYRLFNTEGQWYVQARAVEVDEIRNFRVDRMREVHILDDTFDLPELLPEPRVYEPRPEDPLIVLELAPEGNWVVEQYPTEFVEPLEGGWLRVGLKVSEEAWLHRLLLRLGKRARVSEGRATVADSARNILRRYETGEYETAGVGS